MSHERDTLEAVIAARSAAQSGLAAAKSNPGDPAAMAELAAAQGQLNAGLGRLLAVAEAYPDLKANQNMMQLTEELTTTENKVAFARQAVSYTHLDVYKRQMPSCWRTRITDPQHAVVARDPAAQCGRFAFWGCEECMRCAVHSRPPARMPGARRSLMRLA